MRLLSVVGATASGKSALALTLAERFGGEIVSCDSMQVYREMDIGTAKPTPEERARVPHHLVDFLPPTANYNVADYVRDAEKAIGEITKRGKLPIVVGGTGLYLDALLRGGVPGETAPTDEAVRAKYLDYAAKNGNHALWEKLNSADAQSAAAIHENNVRRVARALEIYELTGKTKTAWDEESRKLPPKYQAIVLGIRFEDKTLLHRRMDERVDAMMAAGLPEEVRRLKEKGVFDVNTTAAQAIGYKELLSCLSGESTVEEAVEKLKTATHQYGKRQMTWFASKPYVRWLDYSEHLSEDAADHIMSEWGDFYV